jgi:hypothetical protein
LRRTRGPLLLDWVGAGRPTPLWLALIFGGSVAVALQISVVDPREQ